MRWEGEGCLQNRTRTRRLARQCQPKVRPPLTLPPTAAVRRSAGPSLSRERARERAAAHLVLSLALPAQHCFLDGVHEGARFGARTRIFVLEPEIPFRLGVDLAHKEGRSGMIESCRLILENAKILVHEAFEPDAKERRQGVEPGDRPIKRISELDFFPRKRC